VNGCCETILNHQKRIRGVHISSDAHTDTMAAIFIRGDGEESEATLVVERQ